MDELVMVDNIKLSRELGLGFTLPDMPVSGIKKRRDGGNYGETQNAKILRAMHVNVNHSWNFWEEQYNKSRYDIRFAYDEQWDPAAKQKREIENRPILSPTLIPQYIHRIAGVARQSKFSIHVQQVGGPEDAAVKVNSGESMSMAEVMEGLIRDIEAKSKASLKYSRALQHSVEGAIGWLRVRIIRTPYDPFNSEIRIEHVRDRQTVIMDHLAEEPLLSDANFGFISKWVDYDDFHEEWGDKEKTEFLTARDQTGDGVTGFYHSSRFFNDNAIRVGEYYWKDPVTKTAHRYENKDLSDEIICYKGEIDEEVVEELEKQGYENVETLKHRTYDIKCVLCTGDTILEGPFIWPGKVIPIVPVIGRQVDYGEDRTEYHSLHRYSHDSQKMYSWLASRAVERVAKAPDSQWLAEVESIAGLEDRWENANNYTTLTYKLENDETPVPERIAGAEIPAAEIQLLQVQHNNLMQSIGLTDSSLGRKSNETSGAAIQQRQMAGEFGSLEFIDNLSYAIAQLGDICCEIIPKVYSGSKIRRLIMADNTPVKVILNQKIVDPETGTEHTYNQIGLARFATTSVAGPAFATQRQEMAEMMMELGKTNPETVGLTFDKIIESLDFPNKDAISKRFKATLPRHILSPEELEGMPEPQPTPEQEIQKMQIQADQAKAQSEGQKAQAEAQKAQAIQMQVQLEMQRLQYELDKSRIEHDRMIKVSELQVEEKQAILDQENLEYEKKKLELQIAREQKQQEADIDSKIQPAIKKAMAEQKSTEMQKSRQKAA